MASCSPYGLSNSTSNLHTRTSPCWKLPRQYIRRLGVATCVHQYQLVLAGPLDAAQIASWPAWPFSGKSMLHVSYCHTRSAVWAYRGKDNHVPVIHRSTMLPSTTSYNPMIYLFKYGY